MNQRCILCGKEESLYEHLCIRCFKTRNRLAVVPEKINFTRCAHCDAVLIGKKWLYPDSTDECIKQVIQKSIKWHENAKNPAMKLELVFKSDNEIDTKVCAQAEISGVLCEGQYDVNISVTKATCNICSRKHGGYYEAKIQLRAEKEITNFIDCVSDIINREQNKNAFLARYEKVPGGVDFYVSPVSIGGKIAKFFVTKYNAKCIISKKLITRKDGKDAYRVTYLLRLLS